jgi:hypothetical protein
VARITTRNRWSNTGHEQAADKEKRVLFSAVAFFLSDLKLGMTSLLITLSIAQLSENFKLARASEKGSL